MKSLYLYCAHGSGASSTDHDKPVWWSKCYDRYESRLVIDHKNIGVDTIRTEILFKSCIDAGISLYEGKLIKDFRLICTRGGLGHRCEKFVIDNNATPLQEYFKIAVGKSWGAMDIINCVNNGMSFDFLITIDPTKFPTSELVAEINRDSIKEVMNFYQKNDGCYGRIVISKQPNTIITNTPVVFRDISHSNIDEYICTHAIDGKKLDTLIYNYVRDYKYE